MNTEFNHLLFWVVCWKIRVS